MLGRDNHKFLF